jgi:hypothetical protein
MLWLQKKETYVCFATTDCLSVCLKKASWLFGICLQSWVVRDCKKRNCLIAKSSGLFLWLQIKKKKNLTSVRLQQFDVRDCNQGNVRLQKEREPDFCLCGWKKENWLFGIWLQAWVASDCKKAKSVSLQKLLVYFCDCKKKEKLNKCTIATIWRAWLQQFGVRDCNNLTGVRLQTLSVWVEKKETRLFGIWLQAWVIKNCKKLKCLIARTAGLFLWLQKIKRKRKTEPVCDCNQGECAVAKKKKTWLCLCGWKRN